MPLGHFLEISVAAPDIAASLAFYEALGFVQVPVGEAWPHAYAVVTDGRLYLGLHALDLEAPLLTWVAPGLRERVTALAALGVEVVEARLDDLGLNEARFADPTGQLVRLLEARTFSPPTIASTHRSALGYFEEYAVGTADVAVAGAFWERLGFVAFDAPEPPLPRLVAAHRDLNIGLHEGLVASGPLLVFSVEDLKARITALRDGGHVFARRLPRGLAAHDAALLHAPEGTALLLVADFG